ncbi:LysR family transcriptional regulator [Pararhodospirillum photometricum]|nr:LysR family transcriptional regulator [Pararhodospirillum photometricum]
MAAALPALTDVDLRLLRVFLTVVACGGFSAAAVELNISRAAVSLHMADLEQRLGLSLCRRGRAGFRLSDDGKAVHEAAQRLLAAAESFRGEIHALHARLRGTLTIGITDNLVTLPHMRVTHALRGLKERGPDVHVAIRMMPPPDIERGVLDGRLHIGVVPATRPLPGLLAFALYDEEAQLYCGADHPLFAVPEAEITPARLACYDMVAVSPAPTTAPARVTATASDREGVAFLILTGCYLGQLPTHMARQWVAQGRMRALRPDLYRDHVAFQAVIQKGARPNLVLETFLALLK